MNKKSPFSAPEAHDKISRLIALPLLKTEFKEGGAPDYSIDTIIKIQKMVNTRPKIDLARFKKGKEYFIEYSKNVSDYLKNTNLNKELKLLDLKNYKDNNNWATTRQSNLESRELIFRTYNFIKTISLYNSGGAANNSYNVYSYNKNNNLLILDNIYYLLKS